MTVLSRRLARAAALPGLWLAVVMTASAAPAAVTVDQLAVPPAGARQFSIVSSAGTHGHLAQWTLPDGTHMERRSLALRGMVTEVDVAIRPGADGLPAALDVRGFTPGGDAAETFRVAGRTATWKSQVDGGSAPYESPAFYVAEGIVSPAALVDALLAAPSHELALLPGGRARIERLTELEVADGAGRLPLVCWIILGIDTQPWPVWTTKDGRYWATVWGLGTLPVGHEGDYPALQARQDQALAERSPALMRSLARRMDAPVAFTHVRAFVDGTRFAEDQTVVVDQGRIRAVGRAADVAVPTGAQVVDGEGRTLVPGLWDSHQHVGTDADGPYLLSLGITSVRDPGNVAALTASRATRRAAGGLLMPHVHPSLMIDGKGPLSAQVGSTVTSLDEALAAVRGAPAQGFSAVKFYGSFDPAWVAPAATLAHQLGLHVHGHVPAGMRPSEAIRAGYDELTHIYFVMMEAMPDDVVKTSNGIGRFVATGRHARGVDLSAPPITTLVALMKAKHVAVDPTLVVAEGILVPDNGDLSDSVRPYLGTLPPASERGYREGGFEVPADLTRADFRASFDKLVGLVGAMHRAGVRIVAGTDSSGLELVHELELYQRAGFTPEEALAAATVEAARNVGAGDRVGMIAVGQAADLVLVEGDPSRRLGDLRNTRVVLMDGLWLDADALRAAAGFSGRPRMGH